MFRSCIELVMAAFLIVSVTSCESSIEISEDFELVDDASVLAQRIRYINEPIDVFDHVEVPTSRRVAASYSSLSLTPQYVLADGYTTLIEGDYTQNLQINDGDLVCISESARFSGGVTLSGGTLVVMGTAELDWLSGPKGTVINNPTGTIQSNGLSLNHNITFANYGCIDMPSWASLAMNGPFENHSEISVNSLFINAKGLLYNTGTIHVEQNFSISSLCYNHGTFDIGNCLHINANGELQNNCTISIGANMTHNGVFVNKGFVDITNCFYVNNNKGFEMEAAALIKAQRVFVNDDIRSSGPGLSVIYAADRIFHNKGEIADNVVLTTDESDCFIPASECSPGIGFEPSYNLLFEIEPPMYHGQLLSATCVQVMDDMVYVSYHMNGEGYGAAIDVFALHGNNKPTLVQTLFASSFDFNEFKIDDKLTNGKRRMWVVGAQRMSSRNNFKSAAVALEMLLNQGFIYDFYHDVIDLKGSSGNSIVKSGEDLVIVSGSNGGLSLVDYQTFNPSSFVPLDNSKYFNVLGDDAVSLVASPSDAVLSRYKAGSYYDTPDVSARIGKITPYDGKLVVHLDDKYTYLSCAAAGLKVFETSTLTPMGSYREATSSTNCVTTDEDFVYLANGADGLLILDKERLNKIGSYAFDGSANYVSTFNDLIFVADGRGGFKVINRVH